MNYIETLKEQIFSMAQGFVASLPGLAIATMIIVITWLAAKLALSIVSRVVENTPMRESLKQLVKTLVKLGVWVVGLLIAMTVAMPGLTPSSLVAGLGIGALAVGFAFQDIFENFLAGMLIMLRQEMRIGDVIEVEGIRGKVTHITLRETHIRQLSNELTIVPNSILFKNPVEILTQDEERRDSVVIGVSYDTDLPQAQEVIRNAVKTVGSINNDQPVDVFAQEFNSSSVDFLVRWWGSSKPGEQRATKSEIVFAIKRALDQAKIEIPFPYVTHTFAEPVPLAGKNAPK